MVRQRLLLLRRPRQLRERSGGLFPTDLSLHVRRGLQRPEVRHRRLLHVPFVPAILRGGLPGRSWLQPQRRTDRFFGERPVRRYWPEALSFKATTAKGKASAAWRGLFL